MRETIGEAGGTLAAEGLAADLCRLLEEQMTCVREGNLSRVEQCGEQANALVARISSAAQGKPSLSAGARERLRVLYTDLMLALKGERDDVCERLQRLRAVRRALGAYRSGVRRK